MCYYTLPLKSFPSPIRYQLCTGPKQSDLVIINCFVVMVFWHNSVMYIPSQCYSSIPTQVYFFFPSLFSFFYWVLFFFPFSLSFTGFFSFFPFLLSFTLFALLLLVLIYDFVFALFQIYFPHYIDAPNSNLFIF